MFTTLGRLGSRRGMAMTVAGVTLPTLAQCRNKETPKAQEAEAGKVEVQEKVTFDIIPAAQAVTFGGLAGFCSGFVMKKIGRAAAATFGAVFIGFQLAAYSGYVNINWGKVEQAVMGSLDVNKDGKVDSKDASVALHKVVSVLSGNMAATGTGFSAGFLLGLRKG